MNTTTRKPFAPQPYRSGIAISVAAGSWRSIVLADLSTRPTETCRSTRPPFSPRDTWDSSSSSASAANNRPWAALILRSPADSTRKAIWPSTRVTLEMFSGILGSCRAFRMAVKAAAWSLPTNPRCPSTTSWGGIRRRNAGCRQMIPDGR